MTEPPPVPVNAALRSSLIVNHRLCRWLDWTSRPTPGTTALTQAGLQSWLSQLSGAGFEFVFDGDEIELLLAIDHALLTFLQAFSSPGTGAGSICPS